MFSNKRNILILALSAAIIVVMYFAFTEVNKMMSGDNKEMEIKKAVKVFKKVDLAASVADIQAQMPLDSNEIIFLGNSLIEMFPVTEYFKNIKVKNRGISGCFVKDVTDRVATITIRKPSKIFLEVGINDINLGTEPKLVAYDIKVLIDSIHSQSPSTKVYVNSLFPTRDKFVWSNKSIVDCNKLVAENCTKQNATFLNFYPKFVKANEMNDELTSDGLHFNAAAYKIWKEALDEYVN